MRLACPQSCPASPAGSSAGQEAGRAPNKVCGGGQQLPSGCKSRHTKWLSTPAGHVCFRPASQCTAQPPPKAPPPHHSIAGDANHHRGAGALQHKQAVAAVSLTGRLEIVGRRACSGWGGVGQHMMASQSICQAVGSMQHNAQARPKGRGAASRTKPLKTFTHNHTHHLQPHPHRSWCWC